MTTIEIIQNKILNANQLPQQLQQWETQGLQIGFTNGCFDIIHQGHIDYLAKIKNFADILIIGLNSDASVRRLKGANRPINDEYSRALILSSFLFVDAVVLFEEDTPYELIKLVQPDVLVKGSDYKPENIVGYDIIQAKGGKVVTLDYLEGFSTSGIEKRIRESKV